jgi:hypothetical protein
MLPNKVKAAVMTGPGRIESQDFPYPEIGDEAMVVASRCVEFAELTSTHIGARRPNMAGRRQRPRRRSRSSPVMRLSVLLRRSVGGPELALSDQSFGATSGLG